MPAGGGTGPPASLETPWTETGPNLTWEAYRDLELESKMEIPVKRVGALLQRSGQESIQFERLNLCCLHQLEHSIGIRGLLSVKHCV